ncbi:DNA helicase [Vibrio phage phiKT1028]|nr:DNA helicase [Vibrio phage phiKT1028]
MFSGLFGPSIEVDDRRAIISGVSWRHLEQDIVRLYGTTTVTKYMLTRINSRKFEVKSFFLLELNHLITKLLQLKTTRTNRRELVKVKELIQQETWIRDTIVPAISTFNLKQMQQRVKLKPLEPQLRFLETYPARKASYHLKGLLLDGRAGSGKAQPLTAKIKVPGGWETMGNMRPGKVLETPDGGYTTVLGVYPQGVTDVVEITFRDGRKTKCNPEHLWKVYDGKEWSVKETHEIMDTMQDTTYYIPMIEHTIPEDLIPSWYNQGMMLRVGGIHYDPEFHHKCTNDELYSWVRGILEPGKCHGYFNDERLARLIVDITRGLGHQCRIFPSGDRWLVEAHFGFNRLKIESIEVVDQELTQCIMVDHPEHLYITDDYIVTHNTALSLMWSESLPKGKTVAFVPLNVIDEVWSNHMTNNIKHEVWVKPPKFWNSKMERPPAKDDEYYFFHYEFMLDPRADKYMRQIADWNRGNPALKMIIDECHNFNDPNSKRTKKLIQFNEEHGFTDTLPMSGTPIKGLGKESYAVFCLIDAFFKGNVRKAFLDGYGRSRDKLNELLAHRIGAEKYTIAVLDGLGEAPPAERIKVKVPHAEHFTLDAVRNQMRTYIQDRYTYYSNNMDKFITYFNGIIDDYRLYLTKRNDQQALNELDEYLRIVNKFRRDGYNNFTDSELSKRAKKIELDIEEWMPPKERKHFRNAKSIVKYVGLKIQGEALGNVLGKARIEAVKALVEYADLPKYIDHVEKKTLIFTDHIDVVYECDDHLTQQGYDTIFIHGDNTNERDKLVKEFEVSDRKNPLITTFKSLSTGYPLLMANQVLCMNAPWREYILTQTIARVHRQGQTAPTFAYIFELDTQGRENVTGRNLDIMEWSKQQVAEIMSVQHGDDITMVGVAGMEDLFDENFDLWEEVKQVPMKAVTVKALMDLF